LLRLSLPTFLSLDERPERIEFDSEVSELSFVELWPTTVIFFENFYTSQEKR
jgi:hypothetical protein